MDYGKTYGAMHEKNPKHFSGYSIKPYVQEIAGLVWDRSPHRILDYGSGKGYQYLALRVHQHWGDILPHCYDPGVMQLKIRPEGTFGGIICTDVLEHIEEADVDKTLEDIFSFADDHAFVFMAIACRPAKRKKLPDGRNVHVTVKPPEWWDSKLERFKRDGLTIRAVYDEG
jgi:hypothetical protein